VIWGLAQRIWSFAATVRDATSVEILAIQHDSVSTHPKGMLVKNLAGSK